jgi:MerR family transcriptional regulator, light-induced transcriptional regulator
MTSARHLVEVISQYANCSGLSETDNAYPNVERELSKTILERRQQILSTTIETEILPRLMLAHREQVDQERSRRAKRRGFDRDEVAEFSRLVMAHDVSVSRMFVDDFVKQGVTLESVFTKLFAPTARYLGELWTQDRCTFSDVTIGLARIQQLVHEFSPFFEAEVAGRPSGRSALLLPFPGEQHCLGVLILEEFFRRAGWDVWVPIGSTMADVTELVSQESYDVVGFSVITEQPLERIASGIRDVRAASVNRDIIVMVGGRFFNEHPEYVAKVGAEVTDIDGSQTVLRLEKFAGRLRDA